MSLRPCHCEFTSFAVALLFTSVAFAQDPPDVIFPDRALGTAVWKELNLGDEVPDPIVIPRVKLLQLTGLSAPGAGIVDLRGLEYCTNLQGLQLASNEIADVSPLASLVSLEGLYLDTNHIQDVSCLAALVNLKALHLWDNQPTDIPGSVPLNIAGLGGLTRLESLGLQNNSIENISPLAGLISLKSLSIDRNQIQDLSPLVSMPALVGLSAYRNEVVDLTPLTGLSELQYLNIWGNHIEDASCLSVLTNLNTLFLGSNQPIDALDSVPLNIAGLEKLSNLVSLGLEDNSLSALFEMIEPWSMPSLVSLAIDRNQIQDLSPLVNMPALVGLSAYRNEVVDLTPLTGLSELQYLNIWGNHIQDASCLSVLTNLNTLFLGSNQPLDAPYSVPMNIAGLEKLHNLISLGLEDNSITDFLETGEQWTMPSLIGLAIDRNQIQGLSPLVNMPALVNLVAYRNEIQDLSPLEVLPNLAYVVLDNNLVVEVGPLVRNAGIGQGDVLALRDNPLSQQALCVDIPEILRREAAVLYSGECVPCENTPPVANCSGGGTFELGSDVVLLGEVSDVDGDEVTYTWTVDEVVLATGSVQTVLDGEPVQLEPVVVSGLELGEHSAVLSVFDGTDTTNCIADISVQDTSAPTLAPEASPAMLWPPNHQMVDVYVWTNASDNSGAAQLAVEVSCNEAEFGSGGGSTEPDSEIVGIDDMSGTVHLRLRAERSGPGSGRVYTITVTATDSSGNASSAAATVTVAHDKRKKN